jgi:hypothetical protein
MLEKRLDELRYIPHKIRQFCEYRTQRLVLEAWDKIIGKSPINPKTMNEPLVESLVQVILSLSLEERTLLEERLHRKTNWRETLEQIKEHKTAIHARRGGKPFAPPIDEVIRQMREERTNELIRASFPESTKK